jgi:hypothetical protein
MANHDIDPWEKEELLAIRHAGTVFAAAVAVVAALHKSESSSSVDLKLGVAMLLVGIMGSICYQLLTIQVKGRQMPVFRLVSAVCVGIGTFGFALLALYVITS